MNMTDSPRPSMAYVATSKAKGLSLARVLLTLLGVALLPNLAFAAPLPDLTVDSVELPSGRIRPGGSPFSLEWKVSNLGGANATGVEYIVVLSSVPGISVSDRVLHSDTLDLAAGQGPRTITVSISMPSDVPTGAYYLGVIVDPNGLVEEESEQNNIGVTDDVIHVTSPNLTIKTIELPPAELGSHWCLRLDAEGGDGTFAWSVDEKTTLPPGLALEEVREEGSGAVLATLLCGRPSVTGSFQFGLKVVSGDASGAQAYQLVVGESQLGLLITTKELPVALFQSPFSANLVAIGGSAPYGWSLSAGRLPRGLSLRSDGVLSGAAEEDGRFSITVKVRDGKGAEFEQPLDLVVSSPARLTCVTRSLPAKLVGESFSETLLAAGGSRPYTWVSRETRRLATGIGETSVLLGEGPPQGLTLYEGQVSGAAEQIGRYLWSVEVTDASQGRELCTIVVEVGVDHGLTVSTRSLTPAIAGHSYLAKLEASGGSGSLSWALMDGSRLPAGITLGTSGLMEGTPNLEQLEGADRKDFAFLIEVRDSQNRVGIAPLSMSVLATQPKPASPVVTESDEGGCQAASGSSTAFATLIGLGLVALRRRR